MACVGQQWAGIDFLGNAGVPAFAIVPWLLRTAKQQYRCQQLSIVIETGGFLFLPTCHALPEWALAVLTPKLIRALLKQAAVALIVGPVVCPGVFRSQAEMEHRAPGANNGLQV